MLEQIRGSSIEDPFLREYRERGAAWQLGAAITGVSLNFADPGTGNSGGAKDYDPDWNHKIVDRQQENKIHDTSPPPERGIPKTSRSRSI